MVGRKSWTFERRFEIRRRWLCLISFPEQAANGDVMKHFKPVFQKIGAYWGLLFILAIFVPYALGVWDDFGYAGVVLCFFIVLVVIILGRHMKITFWWEGLRKKPAKKINEDNQG
jgi:hypothetical protein